MNASQLGLSEGHIVFVYIWVCGMPVSSALHILFNSFVSLLYSIFGLFLLFDSLFAVIDEMKL